MPWQPWTWGTFTFSFQAVWNVISIGLLYLSVNWIGFYTKYLTERAQRKAFLETRRSLEMRFKTQKENERQERLLLSGRYWKWKWTERERESHILRVAKDKLLQHWTTWWRTDMSFPLKAAKSSWKSNIENIFRSLQKLPHLLCRCQWQERKKETRIVCQKVWRKKRKRKFVCTCCCSFCCQNLILSLFLVSFHFKWNQIEMAEARSSPRGTKGPQRHFRSFESNSNNDKLQTEKWNLLYFQCCHLSWLNRWSETLPWKRKRPWASFNLISFTRFTYIDTSKFPSSLPTSKASLVCPLPGATSGGPDGSLSG